jgi:hypothetical protein
MLRVHEGSLGVLESSKSNSRPSRVNQPASISLNMIAAPVSRFGMASRLPNQGLLFNFLIDQL